MFGMVSDIKVKYYFFVVCILRSLNKHEKSNFASRWLKNSYLQPVLFFLKQIQVFSWNFNRLQYLISLIADTTLERQFKYFWNNKWNKKGHIFMNKKWQAIDISNLEKEK